MWQGGRRPHRRNIEYNFTGRIVAGWMLTHVVTWNVSMSVASVAEGMTLYCRLENSFMKAS
jgi:hypothetical protein